MNDRQFRYFIAVAEELSFSKAARRLNVSQPPLSIQIKALEDELGTPLLVRTKRSVDLTQAGAMFLERATSAVRQMDEASEIVRRAARGEAGQLRVGFTSSVPMLSVFTDLLREFCRTYPRVRLDLQHVTSGMQLQALANRQLDIGILRPAYQFRGHDDLEVLDFWHDRLMVFAPEGHPLAHSRGKVLVQELADMPFVAVSAGAGCGVRDHFTALCAAQGFQPHFVQEAGHLTTVLGLVAAGIGISILPECYTKVGIAGVVHRPLGLAESRSRYVLAVREKNVDRITRNFLGMAQELKSEREAAARAAAPAKLRTVAS